jgi:pyrimidine deaminase RibD-like protein
MDITVSLENDIVTKEGREQAYRAFLWLAEQLRDASAENPFVGGVIYDDKNEGDVLASFEVA